jgi:hypothetical protein
MLRNGGPPWEHNYLHNGSHVCPCSVNRTWSVHVSYYRHGRVKRLNSCFCFVLKQYTRSWWYEHYYFLFIMNNENRKTCMCIQHSTPEHWSARKPVFNHHENSKKMNKDRWFRKQTSRNKEQKKKTSLALNNLADFLYSIWTYIIIGFIIYICFTWWDLLII